MVANLIVDQQAMAKSFQERGDRHSGSLGHHWTELEVARREIDCLQVNQMTIVEEFSVIQTQVESIGDNLCRSGLRKEFLDNSITDAFPSVGSIVASESMVMEYWTMLRMGPRDPTTLPN